MTATAQSPVDNVLAASITARAGALELLVVTTAGRRVLRFTHALAAGLLVRPPAPEAVRHKGDPKPAFTAERRALYLRTFVHHRTSPGLTQAAACAATGAPYDAYITWISNHRADAAAALAAHRTQPSAS